jgi:anti-sigma factor RsiW
MPKVLLQFRHRRFRRDLSAYLDSVLPQRARRRLETHLDSCQACRQELAELRVTVEALGSLPMAEVPRSFALAAAPVAEVRPRPTARRLEFGLRLATATAAFALTLVMIGDLAGLPGGGEKEMPAPLAPAATETQARLQAPPVETPAATMEAAPAETPAAMQAPPVETPAAEETPPPIAAAPVETPAAEETPPAMQAAPVETPTAVAPGITETQREEPPTGAGVPEEEDAEKAATEGAGGEEQTEAYASYDQAAAKEDEGGGLSREEAVRWLEIGLGAGVGVLVVLWALARFQRNIGNRP